jgi:hypothetical protein
MEASGGVKLDVVSVNPSAMVLACYFDSNTPSKIW